MNFESNRYDYDLRWVKHSCDNVLKLWIVLVSFSQIPLWYENLLFLGFHQISLKFQRQLLFLTLLSIRVIVYSIECYLAVTARAGITLDSAGRWRESKRHGTVSLEHWMPAASRQEPSPVVSETLSEAGLVLTSDLGNSLLALLFALHYGIMSEDKVSL